MTSRGHVTEGRSHAPKTYLVRLNKDVRVPVTGTSVRVSLNVHGLSSIGCCGRLDFCEGIRVPRPKEDFRVSVGMPFGRLLG